MSDDSQQPIVIKRITKNAGAHGGAWKIAYADFVTAMMAFFLLMWLIGSTAKGDLQGIAEFFSTPLKVAMQGGVGSGDASHVITGGGQDLTRQAGQVKRGEIEAPRMSVSLLALKSEREKTAPKGSESEQHKAAKAAAGGGATDKASLAALKAEQERQEQRRLEQLKEKIEQALDANGALHPYRKQLLLDITNEGLRVQIVDEKNRPMFDLSSAALKPYTREILREIGSALNGVQNRISLSGHTDATPFVGGDKGVGNWELSASRANASRRELIAGGMAEGKVLRVVGLASTLLYDKADPLSPANRRISIIVLNKRTEDELLRDGGPPLQEAGKSDAALPGDGAPQPEISAAKTGPH